MTTVNEELARVLGKLFVSILVSLVIAPLLLICGLNWILEAGGFGLIPYTLGSFTGALIFRIALKLTVVDSDD